MNKEILEQISKLTYEEYLNSNQEESFESLFGQRRQMAAIILKQAADLKNQTETIKDYREKVRELEKDLEQSYKDYDRAMS